MKFVPLSQGLFSQIDDEDFDRISKWKWSALKDNNNYYAVGWIKYEKGRKSIKLHRFILNAPKDKNVDHIDGNGLNNQKSNLRFATIQQNGWNRKAKRNKLSKYKGVMWEKISKKWKVCINIGGKDKYLGTFISEIDAAKAYDEMAKKYYGDFARLNIN